MMHSGPQDRRLPSFNAEGASGSLRPSDTGQVTVAAWLALVPLAYAAAFPILRSFNEVPLVVAAGAAALSAILLGKIVVPRAQLALSVVATIWMLLSLMRALPTAWTRYYEPSAALQHWAWALLIPLFVTAFYALWHRYGAFIRRRALLLAVLFFVVSRSTYIVAPILPGVFTLYGVDNTTIPVVMLVLIFLFRERRAIAVDAAIIALALLASPSATNTLVFTVAFAVRFTKNFRLIPCFFGTAVLVALLAFPFYALELYRLDPNTGVRAVMWSDARDAVWQTMGVGVGFGTEYFKNYFADIVNADWNMSAEAGQSRLFISTHSAFYDVLLRTGLLGALAFLTWMRRYVRILKQTSLNDARLFSVLGCMIIADLAFSPGIVSVNIFIGVSMTVAVLEWLLQKDSRAISHKPRLAQRNKVRHA